MNCERCNREINHLGRCLPCNYLYKYKSFFPGLRESEEYDLKNHMDINLVKELVSNKKFISRNKEVKEQPKPKRTTIPKKILRCCLRCNVSLTNRKYLYCIDCYKFIRQYANIKSYREFLNVFGLDDCLESKDNYIEFTDDMNKFFDLQDFSVDGMVYGIQA